MVNNQDLREKFLAARKLLIGETTSIEKFESVRVLMKSLNPKVDKTLVACSKAISTIENLQKGDVISLSADNLPENTEEEKKRKKAIVAFIKFYKELGSEVERVLNHLTAKEDGQKGLEEQVSGFGKIAALAKGPFGLITVAAVLIVGSLILIRGNTVQNQKETVRETAVATATPTSKIAQTPSPSPEFSPGKKTKVKVIEYSDKKIPLDKLRVATGPECTDSPREAPHYHVASGNTVFAIDGTEIADPGGCGFGKVDQLPVEEIDAS